MVCYGKAVLLGSVQSGRVESSRVKLRQPCRVWMWCVALSHAEPRQSSRVGSCSVRSSLVESCPVKAVMLGLVEVCQVEVCYVKSGHGPSLTSVHTISELIHHVP